jgi:DNA polymerase III sliding clamp (beta) subunit (PCNA family)
MPSGALKLALRTGRLVLTCVGSRQYGLPTIEASAFPSAAEPHNDALRLKLPSRTLSLLIGRVQQSISADGRANLDGVFVDLEAGVLNFVVVGSHTIAIVRDRETTYPEQLTWQALIPHFALKSVLSLCNEHDEVTLVLDEPTVYAETPDTLVGAVLPREPFVPWRNGVKGLSRTRVANVPAIALSEAVHAIMVARTDRASPIRLWLKKGNLEVALVGEECNASDEIAVDVLDQSDLRTLMQPAYLLDTVRGADANFVLEQDSSGPIIVSTDDYLGLISPISPEAWPGAFD